VSRPAAPEPRPGFALWVVAFFASPLILVAWAAGCALLRATGWPRWRLALASIVAGGLVVVVEGGPVPAVAVHFSGFLGLLSQFGRPMVHLPARGRSWSLRWA
jgi:hypothetical protein